MDRRNAKISVLSSGELEKYEYLTGEDLGYKPDVVQKEKFEYSPLTQIYIKGLNENEKNEGLLERLKNIEGKNEQQLDLIRDHDEKQLHIIGKINTDKTKKIAYYSVKNKTAIDLVNKTRTVIRENRNKNFVCTHSNGTQYDFN